MRSMHDGYIASNRELWNGWTRLHASPVSDYAGLLQKLKAGKTTLQEIKRKELGEVAGKSLLHLQCHFGLDTLSWAREGATVGLHLEFLHEFPRTIRNCHTYVETEPGRFTSRLSPNVEIPDQFSTRATI
jgi:hypothetical protein